MLLTNRTSVPLAFVLGVACDSPPAARTTSPAEDGPNLERRRAADAEARNAADVIRAYFGLGMRVAALDSKWAGCQDESKRYAELLECHKQVVDGIAEAHRQLPAPLKATGACGTEIEQAHRTYISGQLAFHTDHLRWVTEMGKKVSRKMVGKTLSQACDGACNGQPYEPDEATYLRVNEIACTQRIFSCTPAGTVCFISKVADRLGLGESPGTGALTVKGTGTVIR